MVKTPVNHTQKGTPYGVRIDVMMRSVEGRRENRMQRANFELLGDLGMPFSNEERGVVARLKRAPHMGWELMWMRQVQEDVIGKEGLQKTM